MICIATDQAVIDAVNAVVPHATRYATLGAAGLAGVCTADLVLLDLQAAAVLAAVGVDLPGAALVITQGDDLNHAFALAELAGIARVINLPEATDWLAQQAA